MLVFQVLVISALFPVFGISLLHAFRVRESDWSTASAFGFTTILIIGALFYDFGVFRFFVPFVVILLAASILVAAASGRERTVDPEDIPNNSSDARAREPRKINELGSRLRGNDEKSIIQNIPRPRTHHIFIILAIGLTALAGRVPVSNFIFSIGDAGAYVNSANHLAMTGSSTTQFFPLNQILLGIFAFIGGPELTPYGVLLISMASVWFSVQLGLAYFRSWRAGCLAGVVVALNVLAMWFGRLPYSESLMLAANLGALTYWKMAADEPTARYRYYVLFGLFVAMAALTRVTGIIWMLIMSGTLFFLCLRKSHLVRPFVVAFLIAAAGYILSIQIALTWGANYYINWQLDSYLPFLQSTRDIVIFHVVWTAVLVVSTSVVYRFAPITRLPLWISRRADIWTLLGFIGFLFLATLYFSDDWHNWLIASALIDLVSGDVPQNSYYLGHYFTGVAIPLFFIGWYALFRSYNPFRNETWSVFWLFAALFLMITYIRPTYGRSHDVYMYWDRYFLSDTFIIFVVVVSAGLIWCWRRTSTRWFAIAFMGIYMAQAAIWMGANHDNRYLDNGYKMLSWISSIIPAKDSVVFLDNQYHARWLFPNIRRTILTPLSHSFGYTVNGAGVEPGAFSADAPLDYTDVKQALGRGDQVYIISASARGYGKKTILQSLPVATVGHRAFVLTTKASSAGQVFAGKEREFPIVLNVWRVWSRSVEISSTDHSGFYGGGKWTNGDAKLEGLSICPPNGHHKISIETFGYIPKSISSDEINSRIFVNGKHLMGHRLNRTNYVAKLPEEIECIHEIRLKSNVFVPKKLGINSDTRTLGIAVKRITLE